MKNSRWITGMTVAAGLAMGVAGCKVEPKNEPTKVGGDSETNSFTVSPMNREDVKNATGLIIDGTAQAMNTAKDAAVTASQDIRVATDAIRDRHEAERARSAAETPAQQAPTPVPQ